LFKGTIVEPYKCKYWY